MGQEDATTSVGAVKYDEVHIGGGHRLSGSGSRRHRGKSARVVVEGSDVSADVNNRSCQNPRSSTGDVYGEPR